MKTKHAFAYHGLLIQENSYNFLSILLKFQQELYITTLWQREYRYQNSFEVNDFVIQLRSGFETCYERYFY